MTGAAGRRGLRRIAALAVVAAAGWLDACGEGVGPTGGTDSSSVIVSDPVPVAAAVVAFSGPARSVAANEDLVYVSLPPGTIAGGQVATVRKVGATNTVTASMVEGGLDPVPVIASAGDSVQIEVTAPGTAPISFTVAVPTRRRPVVVRADPPPRKRDVALNSAIVIVFNEPVAATSLGSAVQLFHGGTAVPGSVTLLGGTATSAVFRASVDLDPNTDYRLVVSEAVHDLSGDALSASVTVEFTTGTAVAGFPNSIAVVPDTSEILIGSQLQVTATARDSSGNVIGGVPITWLSDNPSVATVSDAGLVTARAVGVAHVSAEGAIYPGVTTVLVTASRAPVDSVALTPDSTAIPLGPFGGTVRLAAVLRDAAGNIISFRQVQWSTSDPTIATVAAASGGRALVTALATGTVTITGTSEGQRGTAAITVVRPGSYLQVAPGGPNFYNGGHTCGVTVDSWVLCWGVNNNGQLGIGTLGSAYTPVGIGGINFSQISATLLRTCALTPGGAAYCWGAGALGIGPLPEQCFDACSQTPLPVLGGHTFTTIGLGGEHTCALTTTGTVYCWGYDGGGLLGIGQAPPEGSPVPVPIPGLTFTDLAVGGTIGYGGEHSCALTADSTAYCWGYNAYGQLGDSTAIARNVPVRVAAGYRFVSLSVGDGHTCGLTADGTAYCWGSNYYGQLGTGTNTGPEGCVYNPFTGSGPSACSTAPVQVAGVTRWASISAGGNHTCAVALDGTGYCWGDQLGDGTGISSATPTPVAGSLRFTSLTAGEWHSCGVTTDGLAYCWGSNSSGQLGDGTDINRLAPVKVAGQP